ncbi:MAG: HAD-IIA family hydrolase [Acidobacteria bacterium]|jgi:4-nitrophenyl phosphatase|nr:MAG: HAD-IIA family hydrolase [Acidobacteriota bacterium]
MKRAVLLLDLDGVLVKDKALNPFPDTVDFLKTLRDRSVPFRVVSNNSTRPPERMIKDLKEKGVQLSQDEFLSPLLVLGDYLRELGVKRLFLLGTAAVREFLTKQGFEVREDIDVEAVVIGQDREIDFIKLKRATSAVFLKGARIVPINLSRIVKDDDGLYFLGAGSLSMAIAHACNYREDIPNLGKPSKRFIDHALRGLCGDEVYLVSDDLYTDLMDAKKLGLKTVFMTTGKYKREEIEKSGFLPDLTFESLSQLINYLDKAVFS